MLKTKLKRFIKSLLGKKEQPQAKKLSKIDILRAGGLKVGKNFNMRFGVIIDPSHYWHISIGDNVTLAPRVHILAHDASTKGYLGYTRIGKVNIGNNVFIGASSIILPGVSIGDDCIIGAGSVVTKSVLNGSVVAGNPAKFICKSSDYIEKRRAEMKTVPVFSEEYTVEKGITSEMKSDMTEKIEDGFGYIV